MFKPVLAFLALAAAAGSAAAAISPPGGISRLLAAPPTEEPVVVLRGVGVQIFECQAVPGDPNGFTWAFQAPEVTLYDEGTVVGRHGAGPTWEATGDRSSVSGAIRARQDGGANNLPWLLMRAQPAGESGLFAGVTSIQRVNTSGGVAPANGCDASHVGGQARVAFAADYYFYRRRG